MKASFKLLCLPSSFLMLSLPAMALDNNWTGTGTTRNWNDPTSWSDPEAVPTGAPHVPNNGAGHGPDEDAVVNTGLANFPTISANVSAQPRDTKVGLGAGLTGRIDHTAGTYNSGGANWTFIGRDGGNGRYNLANTAGTGGTFTNFALGSGSLHAGNRIYLGSNGSATGLMNINTSGSVTLNEEIQIGDGAGSTGTLNMDNGALNVGNLGAIANNGTGTVNMSGGTWTNGGELWIGQGGTGNGKLNISGGSVTSGNWMAVGREGATGVVNLSGTGNLAKIGGADPNAKITVGTGVNGNGTINVADNATLSSNTGMILGENTPTSVGLVNQTGGVVTIGGELIVQGAGVGTYKLVAGVLIANTIEATDGTFDMTGNGRLQAVNTFTGNLNQAGGTVAPGNSPGTMLITGNYTLQAAGKLEIEANGNVPGTNFDVLVVGGDVNLFGDLDIIASAGLTTGDILKIIDNTGVNPLTGMFANHATNGEIFVEDGYQWRINYNVGSDNNDVHLTVLGVPEPSGFALLSLGAFLMLRRRNR